MWWWADPKLSPIHRYTIGGMFDISGLPGRGTPQSPQRNAAWFAQYAYANITGSIAKVNQVSLFVDGIAGDGCSSIFVFLSALSFVIFAL